MNVWYCVYEFVILSINSSDFSSGNSNRSLRNGHMPQSHQVEHCIPWPEWLAGLCGLVTWVVARGPTLWKVPPLISCSVVTLESLDNLWQSPLNFHFSLSPTVKSGPGDWSSTGHIKQQPHPWDSVPGLCWIFWGSWAFSMDVLMLNLELLGSNPWVESAWAGSQRKAELSVMIKSLNPWV